MTNRCVGWLVIATDHPNIVEFLSTGGFIYALVSVILIFFYLITQNIGGLLSQRTKTKAQVD